MATYKTIRFLSRYQGHVKDQTVTHLSKRAQQFVDSGYAEFVDEPEKVSARQEVSRAAVAVETASVAPAEVRSIEYETLDGRRESIPAELQVKPSVHMAMSKATLVDIAERMGIDTDGMTKPDIIEAVQNG